MIDLRFATWCFIIFGAIPFVLGLTSAWWFWKLRLIGKLWPSKLKWDEDAVNLPTQPILLRVLRETDSLGAKTTIAHHLALWANDIRVRLMNAQIRAFAMTFVGYGLIALAARQPKATAPTTSGSDGWTVLLQILTVYTLPVTAAISLFEAYALITCLIDQARKFEDLLDPGAALRRK